MPDVTLSVAATYASEGLESRVLEALRAAGFERRPLRGDELAPLEEFHTLGREATDALADLAGVTAETRVLDVGAGLGGPARRLVRRHGCHVTALDLTEDYCRLSQLLTDRSGLGDRVSVRQGTALELPFADGSFDLVWTQHAAMNIEDKARMYAEARRVLGPGGRLALYDVLRGTGGPVHYPAPWARDPSTSFLVSPAELRALLDAAGFTPQVWEDVSDGVVEWFAERAAAPAGGRPVIGLQLLAPDMPERLANQARNVREGRVRFVRAVLVPRGAP